MSITDTGLHQKKNRAQPSGLSLSVEDAAIVKGMLLRGDRQHDVAAYFGVNPGRVAEIAIGERFADVPAASSSELPSPGPYLRPCEAEAVRLAIASARRELERVERLFGRAAG